MSATTGYYIPGDSWLHARHPLTKLLGVGFILLAAFLLPPIFLAPIATGLLVLALTAGLLAATVRALRIPAVLLASIVAINAVLYPGASDPWLALGPFTLTGEGLTFGLVSAGRLLTVFLAAILFLFTTLADDLMEALVARGVSHRIAFVVLSAVQLVPRMQVRAGAILEAQQARGLSVRGSPARRLRALVPLIGPVVLGSLVDVRERTFALEARGFGAGSHRTAYRLVIDPPIDRWLRWGLGAASTAVVVGALLGVGR
ncbi:MAG: energy-coupling factor transporter transmembrane protein EcfT [Chloroflexota bacterium]|jgi:energy-coupling factor transport system permease protein|nr:energy-coupling factor transporter transmembrane protein EcfT [Chloroflexota bacterium]MDH5243168.1 energy-coupling factor transporter transmembrane protein EcfT [Chloroflexota bacterium]